MAGLTPADRSMSYAIRSQKEITVEKDNAEDEIIVNEEIITEPWSEKVKDRSIV